MWRLVKRIWRWEWFGHVILLGGLSGLYLAIAIPMARNDWRIFWIFTGVYGFLNYCACHANRVFVPRGNYLRVIEGPFCGDEEFVTYDELFYYRVTHRYWFGRILTVDGEAARPNAEILATQKPLAHAAIYYDDRRPVYWIYYRGHSYRALWIDRLD